MKTVTCNGCAFDGACGVQKDRRKALRGMGITAVKFICRDRADVFQPGQAVIFSTFISDEDEGYRGGVVEVSYAGYAIKQMGTKLFGYIKPDAEDVAGEGIPFEARSSGFVKMPIKRVKADNSRPSVDLSLCQHCGGYVNFGQCLKDPAWPPPTRSCAAENVKSSIQEAAE